jgi:hypothetical protein
VIGDRHDATRLYIAAAVFFLGVALATLALASGTAEEARERAKAERRRHAGELAELDDRLDKLEAGVAGAHARISDVEVTAAKKSTPRRSGSSSSRAKSS